MKKLHESAKEILDEATKSSVGDLVLLKNGNLALVKSVSDKETAYWEFVSKSGAVKHNDKFVANVSRFLAKGVIVKN